MMDFLRKYRKTFEHQHGWEAAVECPVCAFIAVPVFNGWTPSLSVGLGSTPKVFANLNCPKCAAPVKSAAEMKLVELFSVVAIPKSNQRMLKWYMAFGIAGLLITAGGLLHFAALRDGNTPSYLLFLLLTPALSLRPLGTWLNYAIASHCKQCACGNPAYKFMGMLGRPCCYRCSTGGQLLRLRN